MQVNGGSSIPMKDLIAWDGVVHPIDDIFIPPKPAAGEEEYPWSGREMTVEDFIERLER